MVVRGLGLFPMARHDGTWQLWSLALPAQPKQIGRHVSLASTRPLPSSPIAHDGWGYRIYTSSSREIYMWSMKTSWHGNSFRVTGPFPSQRDNSIMTSSNGNIFRVTGHFCEEFTGGALVFSLICVWINGWVNNREAGDLRRYPAHCDVTVMVWTFSVFSVVG